MTDIILGNLVGSGATAKVYEWGLGKVCKLYEPNYGDAEYEFQKMKEAYALGIPVPQPYELVEINNRKGFIMEKINGESLMDILMKYLMSCFEKQIPYKEIFASELIQNQIKTVASTLANFHSHTCSLHETDKISLSNGCRYNTYLSDYEKQIVQDLIAKLPAGNSLCHGDPNPGNFIEHENGIRVIDWNNCVRGNYMYDIAEYVLTMRYANVSIALPKSAFRFITEYQAEFSNVFLSEYTKLTNKDLSDLKQWTLPILVSKLNANNPKKKQEKLLEDVHRYLRAL